jgi:hypothetical protein
VSDIGYCTGDAVHYDVISSISQDMAATNQKVFFFSSFHQSRADEARIVMDEIHTIGQQEGGAVWEQILLLAPCPIMSAFSLKIF